MSSDKKPTETRTVGKRKGDLKKKKTWFLEVLLYWAHFKYLADMKGVCTQSLRQAKCGIESRGKKGKKTKIRVATVWTEKKK